MKRLPRVALVAAALLCGLLPGATAEQGAPAPGAAAPGATAGALTGVPAARLALLQRGIDISGWFDPWSDRRQLGTHLTADDAALIRRLGFTFVRLTASPQYLFSTADPSSPPHAIRYYDHAIRMFLDAGLAVIVDPIHGTSSDDTFEDSLARDPAFRRAVAAGWEALARRYSALSADRVFFEVMNEPHISTREPIPASWWPPVQEMLAAAIRRGAPQSTIIATGEDWGGIDGLLRLKPLADANVVYSFHWYDPFVFTHQGADWAGEIPKLLSGIPYPSSPEAVAPAYSRLADPRAKKEVSVYGGDRWDARRVADGLRRASDWGKRNGVPVFCGEFGVYRKVAPQEDRVRWIFDTRSALERLGVGWSMWDYDGGFGLIRYSSPAQRAGRILDGLAVTALGLTPGAWSSASSPATTEGEIVLDLDPVAAFLARTRKAVTMPVSTWPELWSRDASAAVETLQEDASFSPTALVLDHAGSRDWAQSSGLKVAVTDGESFTLTGSVDLRAGSPGTVSLELVTYDAAGNVVTWDFAAVGADASAARNPAGMQVLGTAFAVPPGIAVIEPRWSGRGPVHARLGALRLERETP